MGKEYINAQSAFEDLYVGIMKWGKQGTTKYIKNIHFTILNPLDRDIDTEWRNWNKDYAEFEWQWYLSGNRNADEIGERAKIWKNMQDHDGNVNSNYGWQWLRGNKKSQLQYVIDELRENPMSRRAAISIYDGKETEGYELDTPCTMSITFYIEMDKLNMNVHMRSNDLVFGFCNDQYCFSKLQEMVSNELNLEIGIYHHSVVDMHIYPRHFTLLKHIE